MEDKSIKPSHYDGTKTMQVIDLIPFALGNTIKYLWRGGKKFSEPTVRDLTKAIEYIDLFVEMDRLRHRDELITHPPKDMPSRHTIELIKGAAALYADGDEEKAIDLLMNIKNLIKDDIKKVQDE